ncbi:MAG: iron-sulfur cluster assembly scaffold protein, partial [Panacagrimonas sp.]
EAPRAGRLESGTTVEIGTPAAPFCLRIQVTVDDGRIADAAFLAHGCPYTIATGAWLANWLVGRPAADCASPPIAELRADLEIPQDRAHCWLMAQDLLGHLHVQLASPTTTTR